MSIVIALIVVLAVSGLIINFYRKQPKTGFNPKPTPEPTHPNPPTPEIFPPATPRPPKHEVVVSDETLEEPLNLPVVTAEVIPTTPPSVPTMVAKKKKKPHHKKKSIKKADA